MAMRFNTILLATVLAATAAVGIAGAAALGTDAGISAKGDRLFSANITADGFVTVEYRGDQMSILARVPLASNL